MSRVEALLLHPLGGWDAGGVGWGGATATATISKRRRRYRWRYRWGFFACRGRSRSRVRGCRRWSFPCPTRDGFPPALLIIREVIPHDGLGQADWGPFAEGALVGYPSRRDHLLRGFGFWRWRRRFLAQTFDCLADSCK